MQLQLPTLVSILLAATVNAVAVEKRIPLIAGFTLSTSTVCPLTPGGYPDQASTRVLVAYGGACGQCVPLTLPTTPPLPYSAITDVFVEPRCTVTLFQKSDCSDDGAVTGPNCWTPDGGIKGYKVACPWWPADPPVGSLKPCSTST